MSTRLLPILLPALSCALLLAACGSPPPAPELGPEMCDNGKDDNKDGKADCADPKCFKHPACAASGLENCTDCDDPKCAAKPACEPHSGKEDCLDGIDNDGDGLADCADPDCVTSLSCIQPPKEANCANGLDDDHDGLKDCDDPDCANTAGCVMLDDGAPCVADSQCKGGKCLTEVDTGNPGGACSNAVSCNVANQTGCNGGACVENGTFDLCMPRCSGTTGCRKGYACFDEDKNINTSNSYCIALCTEDSDCTATGQGANYGCNLWSNYCEAKDKGLGKYGAPCNTHSQCESLWCSASKPGGYCLGLWDGQVRTCGGDGLCSYDPSGGDNVGTCADGCGSNADCRGSPYSCQSTAGGNVCWCLELLAPCSTNAQCCSGVCNGLYCSP